VVEEVGDVEGLSVYLLGWIIGDGGLYHPRYAGKRSEYRVVVTQKDEAVLTQCLAPLFETLCNLLNITAKVRVYRRSNRAELRISSKRLYEHFKTLAIRLPDFTKHARLLFIAGLYMAEGEKKGKRIRVWNKNKNLLELVGRWLREYRIEHKIYDDKRHGVYVLEVPRRHREQFLNLFKAYPCNLPPKSPRAAPR